MAKACSAKAIISSVPAHSRMAGEEIVGHQRGSGVMTASSYQRHQERASNKGSISVALVSISINSLINMAGQ